MQQLVKEKDQVLLYRLQGELHAIDFLVSLTGKAREYVTGLASGKFNKIG